MALARGRGGWRGIGVALALLLPGGCGGGGEPPMIVDLVSEGFREGSLSAAGLVTMPSGLPFTGDIDEHDPGVVGRQFFSFALPAIPEGHYLLSATLLLHQRAVFGSPHLSHGTLVADHVAAGRLRLDSSIASLMPEWTGIDRAGLTIRDCLEHCTGLPAHRPYFEAMRGRNAYQSAIAREPLEYAPRTRAVYSDLDFILLGFVIESIADASLADQFREWRQVRGQTGDLVFLPTPAMKAQTAVTGFDSWRGRTLQGEVHDQNAAALDGIAGHAGLFGTAAAVGEVARWWATHLPELMAFVQRSSVPNSSRLRISENPITAFSGVRSS